MGKNTVEVVPNPTEEAMNPKVNIKTDIIPLPKETPIVEMEQDPKKLGNLVKMMDETYRSIMVKDTDYGTIPGTYKPTLYKAGAEILCAAFNLLSEVEILSSVEERDPPYFDYTVKVTLYSRKYGTKMGEGMGNCNTGETRYAKRKHGEITKDQIFTLKNTVLKMAIKRGFVDATIRVTGASRIFTQDTEHLKGIIDDEEDDYTPDTTKQSFKPDLNKTYPVSGESPIRKEFKEPIGTTLETQTEFKEPESPFNKVKPETTTPQTDDKMKQNIQWNVPDKDNLDTPPEYKPIPIGSEDSGIFGWFNGKLDELMKDGVQFKKITDEENNLIKLQCGDITSKQYDKLKWYLQWVIARTFKIDKIPQKDIPVWSTEA